MATETYARGGSFLVRQDSPNEAFSPEDLTAEQRQYAKTARDFVQNEVLPASDRIEEKDYSVVLALLRKAGALGLLMADIPQEYGGLGLDKGSSAVIAESLAGQGSFSVMLGAHVCIGTLPLVHYGSTTLKARYLPGLADGSTIGCYCLTEPTAGSDALAVRTKATLSPDGRHYLLNGTKQFITNGGIAQIFTVFAKVDGEHLTCFLLDRQTPGLSVGPEEHKMGIRGSSTTTVVLSDARVPAEQVLGQVGQGSKIAFNILNVGRFKLGAACVGACHRAIEDALRYALERKQFGRRLADLGLIREKLAEMAVRTYAAESASYRTVGMIDRLAAAGGASDEVRSIEEYSVECAIVKILGSETLDYVVDESVQTHGGYGYCSGYAAERYYRDSRVNRIFEGTNEINRLLISAMLLRKATKGEVPLFQAARMLQDELMDPSGFSFDDDVGFLAPERRVSANLKKMCLFVAGVAAQKYGTSIEDRQVVLSRIADLAIQAYAAESSLLRALKIAERSGPGAATLPAAATRVFCETAMGRSEALAKEALAAMEAGDTLDTLLAGLRRVARRTTPDTAALREQIAGALVERERLVF